jgi:signal transduction histidine kinase
MGSATGKGLGLASMRERVDALGGRLDISSASGETCVEARVVWALERPDYADRAQGAEVVREGRVAQEVGGGA